MGISSSSSSTPGWLSVEISRITTGWRGSESGGAAVLAIFLTVELKCQQNQQKQLLVLLWQQKENFPQFLPLASHNHVSPLSISLWLGVPGYFYCYVVWILQPILYFAVAWSSELFVLQCGLEFQAICIAMWLGVPSYLYLAVAWSSELFLL